MSSEHVMNLIPAYTVGALDAEEARMVEAHLAGCATCQAELESYQKVSELLPLAGRSFTPPARLRSSILRAVQPAPARAGWQERLRAWLPAQPAWALAGLVLIAALIASNLFLWGQVRTLRGERSEFRTVALAGTDEAPKASGLLILSGGGEFGALIVDGLPNLPEEKAYQLWLIKDGKRTSGGVFRVLESGYGVMQVKSPEPLSVYTSFGITIEPAGGSPGPTGKKVMGG